MAQAVAQLNEEHRDRGLPEIGVGIGLNTGTMCVGDMGSDIRRSYTVIGDAVNLGSRLEGLSKTYGVSMVVSDSTRALAPGFVWQELDRVRVKGKAQAVGIHTPVALLSTPLPPGQRQELDQWQQFLAAYRAQDWTQCHLLLRALQEAQPASMLYSLYAGRIDALRVLPFQPDWDGSTQFDTK
jgi:adenylate cyclase